MTKVESITHYEIRSQFLKETASSKKEECMIFDLFHSSEMLMWMELADFLVESVHAPLFGVERTRSLPGELSGRYSGGISQGSTSTIFLGGIIIRKEKN